MTIDELALPDWAGLFIPPLVAACAADPRFVGLLLGGSGAHGRMDDYSDLDLLLVCATPASCDEAAAEAPELAGSLGPRLLASYGGEHMGVRGLRICLFEDPLRKVDLKYVALADLPSRFEDGPLLWDRDHVTRDALAASEPAPPAVDRQWIEDHFWVWVYYAVTKAARGELFECLAALALWRGQVFGPLLADRDGRPAQGMRRVEQLDPEEVDAVRATLGDHTRTGCLDAVAAAVDLYLSLRESATPDVVRRDGAERSARAYLAHHRAA